MTRAFSSLLVVGVAVIAAACSNGGGSGSPSAPSSPSGGSAGLTGTWRGTASDSSGPGEMTWQLTQTGSSFTGTMTMTDTATKLTGRGSISGTVSGVNLHFTITVAAGGFDPPYAACTAQANGDGQLSDTSINGTYAGSSSCAGTIASGQVSLTKQ